MKRWAFRTPSMAGWHTTNIEDLRDWDLCDLASEGGFLPFRENTTEDVASKYRIPSVPKWRFTPSVAYLHSSPPPPDT